MEKITKVEKLSQLDLTNSYVITSDVVYNLFASKLNLKNYLIIDENGYPENVKTFTNCEKIISFLIENEIDRDQSIYVLGGGSIGDALSFASSIYKRGIKVINIPTTLLACIDSSIGGKNAINFHGIKNVVGTFWPSREIIIVKEIVENFNEDIIKYGKGEIFKYLLLSKNITFQDLINPNINTILKCIKFKQEIVEIDPHDQNIRFCLNLGHSLGHVFESELKLPHGEAICYGIYFEHLYLFKINKISNLIFEEIKKLFESLNLPKLDFSKINLDKKLKQDKKIVNKRLVLPYIQEIGTFDFVNIEIENLIEVIKHEF